MCCKTAKGLLRFANNVLDVEITRLCYRFVDQDLIGRGLVNLQDLHDNVVMLSSELKLVVSTYQRDNVKLGLHYLHDEPASNRELFINNVCRNFTPYGDFEQCKVYCPKLANSLATCDDELLAKLWAVHCACDYAHRDDDLLVSSDMRKAANNARKRLGLATK